MMLCWKVTGGGFVKVWGFREISFLYGIVLLHGSEDIPKQQVTYQRVNGGLSVH